MQLLVSQFVFPNNVHYCTVLRGADQFCVSCKQTVHHDSLRVILMCNWAQEQIMWKFRQVVAKDPSPFERGHRTVQMALV